MSFYEKNICEIHFLKFDRIFESKLLPLMRIELNSNFLFKQNKDSFKAFNIKKEAKNEALGL
jgi:hypothetical protein